MPRLSNDERNQAIGMLNKGTSATVVSRHLIWLYSKDYWAFTETIQYHRKHCRPSSKWQAMCDQCCRWLLYRLATPMEQASDCSSKPEESMVFIHRLSEIGLDKTFNLFVRTDHTSLKFSPKVIERQGGIGAAITCTSDGLIGVRFCFPMNVGLTLAMPTDAREFITVRGSVLQMHALFSGKFQRWFSLSLGWDNIQRYVNSMRRHITEW